MKKYDLHCHTSVSPCSNMNPKQLVKAALKQNLDGIAVTNHDTLEGYAEVEEESPEELEVIRGVEVTTSTGHMLGLDIEEVPSAEKAVDFAKEIKDLGGCAILAHPFDSFREKYPEEELEEIADVVDAVESVNSRCLLPRFNSCAKKFANEKGLSFTGGSDAHFRFEVGRAYTVFKKDFRKALREGSTNGRGRGIYFSGHAATKTLDAISYLKRYA